MTTREEYAEARTAAAVAFWPPWADEHKEITINVLRALADGAVLCEHSKTGPLEYIPLDPQP
jgi:hypothetical protein